jgi:hypothetical protein
MLPPFMKKADNKNRKSKDCNLQQYPLSTTLLHCLQPPAFSSPGHCSLLILEASDRPPCQRHLRRKKRSSRVEIEAAESQSWALMVVECEVSSLPPCLQSSKAAYRYWQKEKTKPFAKNINVPSACLLHVLHLQAFVWYSLRMGPLQCSASSCLIASPSSSSRFSLVHDPEDGFIAMGAEIGWRRQKTGGLLWFGSRHKHRRSHHRNDHCTEQRKPQTPTLVCSGSLKVLPKLFKHNLPTIPVWINKNSITDFHSNSHLHFLPICSLQYVSDPLADDHRLLVLCCWWLQILLLMIIDWFVCWLWFRSPDPFVDDDDWSDPLVADDHRPLCWQWWWFCCFQNL